MLGHKKLDTTTLYTHVAVKALSNVTSPLDYLFEGVKPPPDARRGQCHGRRSRWRISSTAAGRLGVRINAGAGLGQRKVMSAIERCARWRWVVMSTAAKPARICGSRTLLR